MCFPPAVFSLEPVPSSFFFFELHLGDLILSYPCAQVVVPGRGRGRGAVPIGRGRPMATRQRQRGAASERCTVSIEGLSSSTTDLQLQNLLRSIGPIEVGDIVALSSDLMCL